MSAWRVSHKHVSILVDAALFQCRPMHYTYRGKRILVSAENCQRIARILDQANRRSILCRYPGDREYAECGRKGIRFFRLQEIFSPMAVFKFLNSYEYQTCEFAGWPKTEAYAFCRALEKEIVSRMSRMLCKLPEYDSAPWSI